MKDTYFRRLIVPVVVTILFLCLAFVLILRKPGVVSTWPTFSSASQIFKVNSG